MDGRGGGPHERGFSLVELLVAMTLGLILISSMITVFSANRRSTELNAAMANLQESARFALDAIARDVRMSGYQGCLDVNSGTITIRAKSAPTSDLRLTSTSGSVVKSASEWDPEPLPGFDEPTENPAVLGTHTLQVQFGDAETTTLASQMSFDGAVSPNGPLELSAPIGLESGDLAIIANCDSGDLFSVSAVGADGLTVDHADTVNTSGSLTRPYGDEQTIAQTRVMRFSSHIYYVGDTGRRNDSEQPIRALYRQSLPYGSSDNPPIELVEGVEDMRVAFGIRQSSGALRFVDAQDSLYAPERVESVQIGLLMSSWEAIAGQDDTSTYVLAGHSIAASDDPSAADTHPEDRRLRLAFNTTVKIRNRRNGT